MMRTIRCLLVGMVVTVVTGACDSKPAEEPAAPPVSTSASTQPVGATPPVP